MDRDAGGGLDADLVLAGQAPGVRELHEAARAVAALLDLAAVGVDDAVAEVVGGVARLFHHQQLVAADAEMPVGEAPHLVA
jgi:hypothetical protein